jgi:LacI family transcriptional regulator
MTRKVTIKDVARHCGFSFKTVARVVADVPTVNPEIREKVRAAIAELGYETNVVARNLRARASYTLGLVYDQAMADVQKGVLVACRAAGYGLQIVPVDRAAASVGDEIVSAAVRGRLAGLVLTPPLSESAEILALLKRHAIRYGIIVAGSEAAAGEAACVYVDDRRAAFDITGHLIDLGHRRIGFIWGDADHGSSQARYAGYRDALSSRQVGLDKELVAFGDYTFESGIRYGTRLLQQTPRPSALVGCNDEIAAGALIAARMLGLDVPRDVSIAGFEDSRFSRQAWPPITTARQPTERIAETATRLLIALLSGKDAAAVVPQGFIPELLVRASTGPA